MLTFGSFSTEEAGPFHLPVAQRATATGGSNEVEVTLYALDTSGRDQHAIRVQMIARVAQELGLQLLAAADEADQAKGR